MKFLSAKFKKVIRYCIYAVIVSLFLICTAFITTIYSSWGSRNLLEVGAYAAGGQLKIDNVTNGIAQNLIIQGLKYQDSQVQVDIKKLELQWDWLDIFSGGITIAKFHLDKTEITLLNTPDKKETVQNQPFNYQELMDIDLGLLVHLKLSDISIAETSVLVGEEKYSIEAAQLSSSLDDEVFRIDIANTDADIGGQGVGIKAALTVDTKGGVLAINGDFAWDTQIGKIRCSGSGRVDGDLTNLVIAHNLKEPWQIDTQVKFAISAQMKPEFSLVTNWREIDLSSFNSPALLKNGAIEISGGSKGLDFVFSTHAKPNKTEDILLDVNTLGSFDWRKVKIDSMNIKSKDLFDSTFSGEIGIGQNIDWNLDSKTIVHNVDKYVPVLGVKDITPEVAISGKFLLDQNNGESDISVTVPAVLGSKLVANIDLSFNQKQVKAMLTVDSPYSVNSQIEYGLADNSINLIMDWQNVFWPLVNGAVADMDSDAEQSEFAGYRDDLLISQSGKLTLTGGIDDYKLGTKFSLKYDKWHPSIEVNGKGSLDGFQVQNSNIASVAGNLSSDADIVWAPQLSWKANILGDAINLKALDLQQSDITFKLFNHGSLQGGSIKTQAELIDLGGTIGKDQLSGTGKLDFSQTESIHDKQLSPIDLQQKVKNVDIYTADTGIKSDLNLNLGVNLGKTRAKLSLNASQAQGMQKIDGKYDINVESLSQFIPRSKGQIKLSGIISGDNDSIKAHGNAAINGVKLVNFKLNQGKLGYIVTQQKGSDLFAKLDGNFSNINANQIDINSLEIDGEGSLLSHKLKLTMNGDYSGGFMVFGSMLEQLDANNNPAPQWNGEVKDFNVVNEDIGKWINKKIILAYQGDAFSIAETCFAGNSVPNDEKLKSSDSINSKANSTVSDEKNINDEICVNSEISPDIIDAQLSVNRLNLQRFASLVPKGIGIYGTLKGETSIYIKQLDYLNAKLSSQLLSEGGMLELTLLDNTKKALPLNFNFLTQLENRQGNLFFTAKAEEGLDSQGKIIFTLPQNIDRLNETAIDSTISIDMSNFEWVDEIWPEFESVTGKLVTNARVYGQLDNLEYSGSSNISSGSISIIPAGIIVSEAALSVNFDADKTVFSGKGKSGDGAISIAGDFDKKSIYPININVLGDKFQVIDIYEAKVAISPLLKLKLLENQAKLDGSINIDHARIRIGDLPETAVSVSDDVVIHDRGNNKQLESYQTDANISLNLGDEFSFKGFGLTTKITGGLDIKQANGLREGFGELELKEGKFKKLGIKLDIETGQLIFVGPLENPALNIKAARKLEKAKRNSKVSVMITGTLKKPVLVFPEESTYGQTNAMSNLLTGKSVGESGGGGGGNEALYSVGLSAGGKFKDQVQDELGIDAMEITAAGWMLGKYLTPDLYLSYTTGWIENESALKLRYSLSEMLSVEVNSGQQQGVDLFYSIEKPSK